MNNIQAGNRWRTLGGSVRGISHERTETPNQDAIKWIPESGEGPPIIMAISDGHGSAKSFRSGKGASLAVEVGVSLVSKDKWDIINDYNPTTMKRLAEDQIPRAIVRSWRKAVEAHYDANPITDEEREMLKQKEGEMALTLIESNPFLVYGATLLITFVTSQYALFLQIGDGDIVVVNSVGTAMKPIPEDDRLFANATTSLCSEEAWKDFRQAFMMHNDSPPKMIMLSTDGYSNSFETQDGFFKIGTDIAHMLDEGRWNEVNGNLTKWLADASIHGSGDDITVGILAPANSSCGPQKILTVDCLR